MHECYICCQQHDFVGIVGITTTIHYLCAIDDVVVVVVALRETSLRCGFLVCVYYYEKDNAGRFYLKKDKDVKYIPLASIIHVNIVLLFDLLYIFIQRDIKLQHATPPHSFFSIFFGCRRWGE